MTTVDKSTKVYSTFDPRVVQNCSLWLDGADASTLTLSGSNVTTWKDKSGNAYDASTGAASPTYSNKGVVFNGTTQYLTSNYSASLQSESVFIIGTLTATPSGGRTLLASSANGGRQLFTWNTTLQVNKQGIAAGPSGGTVTQNAISLFEYTTASGSPNNTINLYINGTSAVSGTLATYTTSLTCWIGRWPGSTTEGWVGPIYEIVAFNRTLSSTERQQIEGYLAWKWGLQASLPVGHPYLNTIKHGPVLSPFTPTDITNCALWLDAADASTVTGTTNVTQWKDKSGNSRNFTNTTGPSYSSNTMTFNGTTQFLGNTSWNNFDVQTHTLIAVHQPNTSSAYKGNTRLFSIQQTAGNPYAVFPYLNSTTPNGYINDRNASLNPSAGKTNLLDNSSTSSYNIITASIANGAQAVYKNGTLQDSQTFALSSGTVTTGVFIGNQYAEWYSGSVKEIIIYTSALELSDVITIEGYLAWKWGLQGSLPSTHPYKNFYPLKIN